MSDDAVLQISKTMLIIKSDINSMRGVEQFLKNREWFLKSTNQMKDAVLFLVQHKPSFVLVCVDHPNRKMQKLPKILASAFPCCVIVYAEKPTTAAFKALQDSGAEYKINPPVTGPAIERAVNKYIRDQEQATRLQDPTQAGFGANQGRFEFNVEIKSDSHQAAGFLSRSVESGSSSSSSGITEGQDNPNQFAQSLLAQLGLNDEDMPQTADPSESDVMIGRARAKKNTEVDPSPTADEAREHYVPTGGKSKNADPILNGQAPIPNNVILGRAADDEKSTPGRGSEDKDQKSNRLSNGRLYVRSNGAFDKESLLIKGVVKTLDESVEKKDGFLQENLQDNTHLACIIVESPKFSGSRAWKR